MPLTPLDVENLRLRGALRGYDRGDVDHFRAEVVATIEEHVDQIARLKMRLRELEGELARFREQEDTLKSSVLLAQRTADELVAAARERAGALLEQARSEAEQVRRGVADVAAQREQFEYQFHGLLSGFLSRLEQGNPRLGSGPERAANNAQPRRAVSNPMDTPQIPEESDHDVRIDMEDLTAEEIDRVNDEEDGSETVVLPIAQPLPHAGGNGHDHPVRADRDSHAFNAALESAASREAALGGQPGEPPGAAATETLGEIASDWLRHEGDRDQGLPEVQDQP